MYKGRAKSTSVARTIIKPEGWNDLSRGYDGSPHYRFFHMRAIIEAKAFFPLGIIMVLVFFAFWDEDHH